jgi:DNA helicase HerA-like ATPase
MENEDRQPAYLYKETPSALDAAHPPATDFHLRLDAAIQAAGGELSDDPALADAVGATLFDLPGSEDGTITVVLPQANLHRAPSQALVRIRSRDGRTYLGMVTAGPFAEPDNLRGDAPMLVTVTARGGFYLPPYHGRVQVTLLGEEQADGSLVPPRLRPLPNSPVSVLDDAASAAVLRAEGAIRLGLAIGYAQLPVAVPSDQKAVLPRHTAVLGTTGGGKSTTIARLIQQAQAAGMAVVVLDVEGEYTFLHEPTDDARMLRALAERGLAPAGLDEREIGLYHLVGRDTTNPDHPHLRTFSLLFEHLSPHTVMEILDLSEAQQERFLKAYDIAKNVLRKLHIYPVPGNAEQERAALELDEFERGYPCLTLTLLMDVVGACLAAVDKTERLPSTPFLATTEGREALVEAIRQQGIPGNLTSWRALLGRLSRLNRLRVFDRRDKDVRPIDCKLFLRPGRVSLVDLSDTGMSELSNLVIADLLRGIQEAQDDLYTAYERDKATGSAATTPPRVLIVIEEAHEFLSQERIKQMPTLFEQVARIAKRGRKRWLGLVFVTQLPQHLPRQVFGLVNSYILHKITDPEVVHTLQRTISGIDASLWLRLPGLAPGQAIVSFPHMTRPLLVSIDPTPAKLRLVD